MRRQSKGAMRNLDGSVDLR
jgi:hypothetical protein